MKEERFLYRIHLFFLLLILLPINTFATECHFSENTCVSYDGCEIIDTGSIGGNDCYTCDPHYYNNSTTNSTSCISCENYDFDTINTGKQWNSTDDSRGNTECPWICTNNWYKSGNSCVHCPTGATSPAGSTTPTQCQCEQNKYLTQNNGEYIWQSCPTHSFTNASGSTSITDCQCEAQYYMGGINNNQCVSCPEHGNCAYAGHTYLTATCDSRYQNATRPATSVRVANAFFSDFHNCPASAIASIVVKQTLWSVCAYFGP